MGIDISKLEEASQSQSQSQPQPHLQHDGDKQASPLMGTPQTQTQTQKEVMRQQSLKKPPPPPSSSSSPLHLHHRPEPPVIKPQSSLPSNFEDILKDADSPLLKSYEEKLHDHLYSGVFLHNKTMKYWVDKKSNCNCFMLYAKALSITWSDTPSYWKWVRLEESRGTMIEMAELKAVCWLEIHGRFDTRKLTPGILYEVSFHVMVKDPAQGWEVPVNVRLVLPGGKKKQEHKENLRDKMRVRWLEIPVGQFVASGDEDDGGDMEVSMYEIEAGIWKQGLVIKGVSIKPNVDNYKLSL